MALDEPGHQGRAVCVDHACVAALARSPISRDLRDAIALYQDLRGKTWRTGSINDVDVGEHIVGRIWTGGIIVDLTSGCTMIPYVDSPADYGAMPLPEEPVCG